MIWGQLPVDNIFGYDYQPTKVERPWGYYTVLENGGRYKIKELVLSQGRATSYQRHTKRNEFWYVKSGTGYAMLHNSKHILKPGIQMIVYAGEWHQIVNDGKNLLILHEFQFGTDCIEEDIERM